MFWGIGAFAFALWVLLCNALLFLTSRRPPAKSFSRLTTTNAKVSGGDEAEAGHRDDEVVEVAVLPDGVEDGSSVSGAASASRYEFSPGKRMSGFVEEPKATATSFVVQEMFVDSTKTSPWKGKEMLIHEHLENPAGDGEEEEEEEDDEDGPDRYFDAETSMEMKPMGEMDHDFELVHEEEEWIEVRRELLSSHGDGDNNSLKGSRIESQEGFMRPGLEDEVLGEEYSLSDESRVSSDYEEGEALISEENRVFSASSMGKASAQPDQSDDEYIELDLQERGELLSPENIFEEEDEEEDEQGELGLSGSDEFGEDSLWEHDDIVEQLKLELKNVRTGGLPTILEESESAYESPNKTVHGDLKPMKMDQTVENKDRLGEIQKVYKGYSERMRKLDILNYQTLHAIGLVQLKDPFKSNGGGRCAASTVTSLLYQNSRKSRWRRRQVDPVMESVGAYYKELEMVYIGHVCLSWEILQWQYGKAQELLESSSCSRSVEQYNQVAGELQLFQVLLHRFLEDEPFRGCRVENYARTRCVLRSLLQVPAVKDDCFKDKKARVRDEDAVSCAGLITVIEESMRVFWDFLHADKHEADTVLGCFTPRLADGQQSADSDLVMSLRTQLQKKERRVKDISRIEGCIMKKLRKKDKGRVHHTLLLAQVELRLISRVLTVAKLTRDQVGWCREKMDRINVAGRMIRVEKEPSFLLFPC